MNRRNNFIDNELDLEKRVNIQSIGHLFIPLRQFDSSKILIQSRSNQNLGNYKQTSQIKIKEETRQKQIPRFKGQLSKQNLNNYDHKNIYECLSPRIHNHKGRILKEDRFQSSNNMIHNQQNLHYIEGSQMNYQNPQIQYQDQQVGFNQNIKQQEILNNNQIIQQNNLVMNFNHNRQTKKIIIKDQQSSNDQTQSQKITLISQNFGGQDRIKPYTERNTKLSANNKIIRSHIIETKIVQDYNNFKFVSKGKTSYNKLIQDPEVVPVSQYSNGLLETIMETQVQKCFHCLSALQNSQYQLNCLHIYHIQCLTERISIAITSGNTLFYCKCNTKIPQKIILYLVQYNYQLKNILFQNQLQQLIKAFKDNTRNTHIQFDQNPKIIVKKGINVIK